MEDALANAQPEQVEKLTRAVEKNKQRVKMAQEELQLARVTIESAGSSGDKQLNENGN